MDLNFLNMRPVTTPVQHRHVAGLGNVTLLVIWSCAFAFKLLLMPTLKDEEVITAIATAPSSTVRSVLRALCANNDNKRLIGKMLSELPVTYEQVEQNITKKRKAVHQEICVQ
ncbi:hypothetical protein GE21DRAFT_3837 [Neurospora crassa]|uniref:Uncharacterized protein n=1 Tax=Neurospora crassa (strain ATCC 24698 / 74-OR23-1A / CBS 708.71 / DSM 1257 / FGSC 987) TaxID=367110 RepID=U9WGB2_NEUCR|nr:hypothetical protein NCU16611 [Neurospora crassa OR74A]ESA43123.1 hypothetical protein NCU16611 [Neurospora crassa OR74A]KHE84343.1 hypothetical protein GE21DRAFT_3837 [Neurospora crassa]|eukprot:XP_011394013.1 hypothetical protein NCU16611 [Neurospora crassa OR74A]